MNLSVLLGLGLALPAPATPPAAQPATTYHVMQHLRVGGDGGWDYVAAAGGRLYIARSSHVMVVDIVTGAVVGDIVNTPGVHGAAIASDLGRGFTSNGGDNTVTVFDLKTLREIARVKVGARPDAILYDPGTHRVFTMNAGSSDTTAIDAATAAVVGTVPLGGKPESAQASRGTIYANIEDRSEIVAFGARSLKVAKRWSLAPGEGPSGLAMDQKGRRLFSVCENGMMVVSDADAGRVIATPPIGRGPDAAAYDARNRLAFSSNGQDGTLTIIEDQGQARYRVAAALPTAPGARTMALDSGTHRIYLIAAKFKAPAPGEVVLPRRRSIEPGSFEVIVVGP